jgi:hypothetical protein
MDLSIWFSDGFAFGWSQFEAVDWAVVPMHIYWKIGLSWLFQPYNLFVKPDHYERIKAYHRCCFYLPSTFLRHCFCNWSRKDDLSVVKSFRQF